MKSALLLLVCVAAMNGLISASSSASGSSAGSAYASGETVSAQVDSISSSAWNAASSGSSASSVSASASVSSVSSISASASSVSSSVSAASSASSVSAASSASSVSSISSVSSASSVSSVSAASSASSASVSASASASGLSLSFSVSASASSVSASLSASLSSVLASIPSSITESASSLAVSLTSAPAVELPSSYEVTVSKSLLKSAVNVLATIAKANPAIMTDLGYAELAMAAYPSVECAEDTIEQEERSHAHTVSLIESAVSSPSTITNPTYIEDIETLYPSIVSAYKTIFDLETSHPQFAYVQTIITSLESSHPTILTDASIEVDATSPSLKEAQTVIYDVLESSPSIHSCLHTVAELASHYPTLSDAENEIAYYEAVCPSVVNVVSEAVLSPTSVHSPLPAEYPTLASCEIAISNIISKVPKDDVSFVSSILRSYSSASAGKKHEFDEIKQKYSTFCSDEDVLQGYKKVDSTLVSEMHSIVSNPEILGEPAVVANPTLAHAEYEIHSKKSVIGSSALNMIEEFECSKQKVKKSSEKKAQEDVEEYTSIASAFRTVEAYKKVNADVVQKVSQELDSSKVTKVHSALREHSKLSHAFSVISDYEKRYHGLAQAQESLDCAESHSAFLFSNYEKFSSHEASAMVSIGTKGRKVQKSMHQSAHQKQSMHQSMHQSAHQSAHQSMHQSAHQSMHQSAHQNMNAAANKLANIHVGIVH